MAARASQSAIKIIGTNGQISLGKQYAGRHVLVEEKEAGVWLVRTATIIPDNERRLQGRRTAADLEAVKDWAWLDNVVGPMDTDFEQAASEQPGEQVRPELDYFQ